MKDYYLYEFVSPRIRAELKKAFKHAGKLQEFNSAHWQKTYINLIADGAIPQDFGLLSVFDEHEFFKNPVCFRPESSEFIDKLSSIKLTSEGILENVRTPADYFMIPIPKSHRFNGEKVRGLFICSNSINERTKSINDFTEKYGTQQLALKSSKEDRTEMFDEKYLTIVYLEDDKNNENSEEVGRITLRKSLSELTELLVVENYKDGVRVNEDTKKAVKVEDLTPGQYETQLQVLRFVLSYLVYMSAHPNAISESTSIQGSIKKGGQKKLIMSTVKNFIPKNSIAPHYRNLRDQRFYKGAWKDWAIGSRWVPVNMKDYKVDESG